MSQSLAKIVVHVIFSTKNREATIGPDLREPLQKYLAGTLNDLKCPAILVGCQPDHAHALCLLGRTISVAELVEQVKKGSSKWMKDQPGGPTDFYWQGGYGAFSVSESNVERVRKYIAEQDEHHRVRTFQDEFRAFLKRHNVPFDERYVWD